MAGPYKMKNSMLKTASKGAPMQMNYGSPARAEDEKEEEKVLSDKKRAEMLVTTQIAEKKKDPMAAITLKYMRGVSLTDKDKATLAEYEKNNSK